MTTTPPTGQLVYDGECGFCAAWVDWGRRRLGSDGVAIDPYQSLDLARLGTTPDRASHEVLWIDAEGRVSGGPDAAAQWLRRGPLWARAAARVLVLRPVRPVARRVYRWVADHRRQLPAPRRR